MRKDYHGSGYASENIPEHWRNVPTNSFLCIIQLSAHLYNICISPALVRLVVLCVFQQHFVHVGAGILKQFVCVVEDDEGDLAVAQDAELVGLFHQAKLALGERHLRGERKNKEASNGRQKSRQLVGNIFFTEKKGKRRG